MKFIHWFIGSFLALGLMGCGMSMTPSPPPDGTPPPVWTPQPLPQADPTQPPVDASAAATEEATETAPSEESTQPEAARPPVDPASVRMDLRPVVQGLARPLFVTHAGDGSDRLFVVGKGGQIWVYGPDRQQGQTFLDISQRVNSSGFEQGLLGLAFPPDYEARGFFFVNYTDQNGHTVVSRFLVSDDPNRADPASEFVILRMEQPASNHNGGMLAFGPDGYLYIGTGDGGRANDAFGHGQNPSTLLGAMLRIDVTSDPAQPYLIPAGNPWVTESWNGQAVRDEIWGLGLRNPWRYSFDRVTGDLWIADVGQNQYEEVHRVAAAALERGGLNFGWPIMEGLNCFQANTCNQDGLDLPVIEYDHSQGCSITGGYVYRGSRFPGLYGAYIYGDYCSGRIWAHWPDGANGPVTRAMLDSRMTLTSFGEDEQGELYLTDFGSGAVYQVVEP